LGIPRIHVRGDAAIMVAFGAIEGLRVANAMCEAETMLARARKRGDSAV
jgi:hypothetical protein